MRASSELGLQKRILTQRNYYCCKSNFMALNCSQNAESYCYTRILFELVNILVWSTVSTHTSVCFSLFFCVTVSTCVLRYACIRVGFLIGSVPLSLPVNRMNWIKLNWIIAWRLQGYIFVISQQIVIFICMPKEFSYLQQSPDLRRSVVTWHAPPPPPRNKLWRARKFVRTML
jgi:hypothetical protein